MAVATACPQCQTGYSMPDEMRGKQARCSKCQTIFAVQPAPGARPPVPSACPACRAAYSFPAEQLGQKVRCGKCQAVFVVGPTPAPGQVPASCPGCQAAYTFPAEQAGKQVRCGKCQAVFAVPGPVRPAAPPAPPPLPPAPPPRVEDRVKPTGPDSLPRPPQPEAVRAGLPPAPPPRPEGAAPVKGDPWYKRVPRRWLAGLAQRWQSWQQRVPRRWLVIGGAGAAVLLVVVVAFAFLGRGGKSADAAEDDKAVAQKPAKDGGDGKGPVKTVSAKVADPDAAKKEELAPLAVGELSDAVLGRVKAATVYLRVTLPDGRIGMGSGFFGLEKGIVLTNAHVLGMLDPDSRLPQRIDVVRDGGTPQEKSYLGQVLGVDRSSDLAVLRVTGDNHPRPLQVRPARGLKETQSVFVFGFPLGERLGKNISVRRSSVSALRTNAQGVLDQVQLEGGMDPGNSGGPVVNSRGEVIGVSVRKILATQLNFAVPGEFVRVIVNGRLTGLTTAPPFKASDGVRVPVALTFLDPLKRLHKVSLDYWAGKPGPARPATQEAPRPADGDGPVKQARLAYQDGKADGEIVLPALSGGQVCWFRPVFVDGAGNTSWAEATPYAPPPLIERKAALLALKVTRAVRDLRVTRTSTLKLVAPDGEGHEIRNTLEGYFLENAHTVHANGTAGLFLRYKELHYSTTIDKEEAPLQAGTRQALAATVRLGTQQVVGRDGKLVRQSADIGVVPAASRAEAIKFHGQILSSLEAVAVPLPGKVMGAGTYWTARSPLSVGAAKAGDAAVLELTYTYVGTRVRNGREEAYITIAGVVHGPDGKERRIGGKASGLGVLDLHTFQIAEAELTVSIDMDIKIDKQSAKANGTLAIRLARGVVPLGGEPEAGNAPRGVPPAIPQPRPPVIPMPRGG